MYNGKNEIIDHFLKSDIFKKWHFFNYHFSFYKKELEHPLSKSIVDLITELENKIPKAGIDYIDKIASINNKERDTKHYDQLLQVLSELMVVHKAATYNWADGDISILYEPKLGTSKKNPN